MAVEGPWFEVRPAAKRRGKMIHLPLTYIGRENLTGAVVLYQAWRSGTSGRFGQGRTVYRAVLDHGS